MFSRVTINDPITGPRVSVWSVTTEEGHIGAAYAAWVQAYGCSPGIAAVLTGSGGDGHIYLHGVRIDVERLEFGEPRTMVKKRPNHTEEVAVA